MSMLLVLCLAVPMYICATGSIPIAVALMMRGLTPGAGLVLLMAGPACNMASILVVGRVLGRRTLITYLASIILGAVGFGLAIDYLLPREWFMQGLVGQDACCMSEHTSWFSIGCTILLALLLVNALVMSRLGGHSHCHCHEHEGHSHCHEHEGHKAACRCGGAEMLLHVEGMTCSHCRESVRRTIAAMPGVTSVEVDLASGVARIEGDVKVADVQAALMEVGFKVHE